MNESSTAVSTGATTADSANHMPAPHTGTTEKASQRRTYGALAVSQTSVAPQTSTSTVELNGQSAMVDGHPMDVNDAEMNKHDLDANASADLQEDQVAETVSELVPDEDALTTAWRTMTLTDRAQIQMARQKMQSLPFSDQDAVIRTEESMRKFSMWELHHDQLMRLPPDDADHATSSQKTGTTCATSSNEPQGGIFLPEYLLNVGMPSLPPLPGRSRSSDLFSIETIQR
jgi:hypothetical protein